MADTLLQPKLTAILDSLPQKAPPEVVKLLTDANKEFQAVYDPKKALQVGDKLPEFRMPNAVGKEVSSADLLARGAILITFYRGEWCPFCSLALQYLQRHVDEFKAKGVELVAITPELPDTSLNTVEKHQLKFEVLSDVGNAYAKKLGILFQQPDSMRPFFAKRGNDLKKRNGDDSFALPVPASFLVDKNGVVRNSFVDPDYSKRLEPAEALKWIDQMQ